MEIRFAFPDLATGWALRHRGRALTVPAQALPSGASVGGFLRH